MHSPIYHIPENCHCDPIIRDVMIQNLSGLDYGMIQQLIAMYIDNSQYIRQISMHI